MIGAVIGLLLPAVATWLWILALRLHRAIGSRAITVAVAVGTGIGLSSVSTMWLMALGVVIGPRFMAADALLWTAIGAAAWWRLRRDGLAREWRAEAPVSESLRRLTTADWLVRALFGVVAVVAVVTAVAEYAAAPHGQWDAWAVWNQKARFIFRGGDEWTAVLAIDWSNPSHPLLVSTTVARLWAYAGAELTMVPAMLGMVFGVAIVAAVMGALDVHRARAWIAGSVLLAPGTFVQQVASQQADVPFAFFMVTTLIVLRADRIASCFETRDGRAPLFLAGTLVSLAAWTKNEGALLVVASALFVAWMAIRGGQSRRIGWWVVGALPALLTLVWFKLFVAPVPPPYLSEALTFATFAERLFGSERRAIVDALIWQRVSVWGGPLATGVVPLGLLVVGCAAVTRTGRSARVMLTAVGLMLVGYYGIYLLTQFDVEWLISTTFDRLMVQIWPVLVLAAFLTDDEPDTSRVRGAPGLNGPETRARSGEPRNVRYDGDC